MTGQKPVGSGERQTGALAHPPANMQADSVSSPQDGWLASHLPGPEVGTPHPLYDASSQRDPVGPLLCRMGSCSLCDGKVV